MMCNAFKLFNDYELCNEFQLNYHNRYYCSQVNLKPHFTVNGR